jgi:hypothetical protein
MLNHSISLRLATVAGLVVFLSGCPARQAPVEESRLSKLAILYGRYISQNKGKTPANEQELKAFIQKVEPDVKVDEIFVSPRDKEPFVVRYNVNEASTANFVTAHEKTGVSGKKMVSLSTGEVRTLNDEELQKLLKTP